MTVETINVKGNANKVLEEHHSKLKSEAKEINNINCLKSKFIQ